MTDSGDLKAARDAQETAWRAAEGERLLVVGIGASAGGLEAFERFLRRVPLRTGLAFVLVQHLDPEHESILPEILGRMTEIPVAFATDGQDIEADHVHVMPPDATLLVEGGRLRLLPTETRGVRQPINAFLTSLAEDQRENAVGIVLSGTGSDGALGVATVKRNGGATFAQLPGEARYESMPQAAIATGMVDRTLPVEEMPAALAELAARRRQHPGESAQGESEGLRELFEVLERQFGHDFSQYKRSTILRRLHRRMTATSTSTIRDYVALLARDEGEGHRLTEDLMINVTAFFRDGEPFQALERIVIPDILERNGSEGVRIWVPSCASGEEVYSVAMLLCERFDRMKRPPKAQIFATDIDASALAEARRGHYGSIIEKQVSPERLARFFVKRGDSYTVTKDIRDLCIFTAHDIARDPPFSRMDLVCCRNLLIYLEPKLQRRVLETLHYALRPGGYLLLGKAEMIGAGELELFEVVEKSERLFRRRDGGRRAALPTLVERDVTALPAGVAPLAPRRGPDVRSAAERSRKIVLEEYAPPSVVIDGRGEIRYLWGRNLAVYLAPQPGPPATNLMHLVRPELKAGLGASLHGAARQPGPVVHEDVRVMVDGVEHRLNVVVRRLPPLDQDADELFLVVFQELQPPPPPATGAPLDAPMLEQYRRLEAELASSRERLQFTVDELENANEALRASNDQLQCTNEELHSSNEELQTSQEELQSVNEELNTVNAELSKKVNEMEVLFGDLQNLFQSTQIATVFLDRDLRIARFTPQATAMFHLADGDVGRPLTDFAARFDAEDVAREVARVLQTLEPMERTVRSLEAGCWYLMRMHPYRTPSNVIAGVVISFVDVTELKKTEAALREAVAERERAEQALKEADRRKDQFLAVLSHELRNPLAPIRNSLHLLERAPSADVAQRAKQVIARQVGHLTRLVEDLLDATRISHGKLQLHRERLDLRELVRRTAEDHGDAFMARGLRLDVEVPERAVWVDGDRTRLAQVVGNLLQNAAKFSTAHGGDVRLVLEVADGVAELHVTDTGVGIEPAMLSHLFEPFSQADDTLDRSGGGLGLGLALVKGLVEAQAGTVEAKSGGRGAGTEFVVRLPLAAVPAPSSTPAAHAKPRPRRVLVVEDNVDGANSLRAVLELDGHTVEVAGDGPSAIDKGHTFRPEVVLCDIGLPGMDGYAVAKAMRSDPALRGALLVAVTGYALPQDQRRAEDAGFDVHLAKPPEVEQLRRAIDRAP